MSGGTASKNISINIDLNEINAKGNVYKLNFINLLSCIKDSFHSYLHGATVQKRNK